MATNTYLRASKVWTAFYSHATAECFLANISGTPVKILISDTPITNFNTTQAVPFTLGGNIGQMHINAGEYVYAKASVEDESEAVVISSPERIAQESQAEMDEQFDALVVEVMKLSQKVTDARTDMIKHKFDYTLFVREMLENSMKNARNTTSLYTNILRLNRRLFAAESLIRALRKEYDYSILCLGDLDEIATTTASVAQLKIDLGNVTSTVNNAVTRLNELEPKIADSWQRYVEQTTELIEPTQTELTAVHATMDELNNAITRLCSAHTAAEIQDAFTALLAVASDDMVAPITALKEMCMEIAANTALNESQKDQIDGKVGYDQTVIIDGEGTVDLTE